MLEVVNKTLAFHTSTNYQILAPEPFADQVHEDLVRDLARIGTQEYASDFDFHLDVYRTFKLVNDGVSAFRTSLGRDMDELTSMPLALRRVQLVLRLWVRISMDSRVRL